MRSLAWAESALSDFEQGISYLAEHDVAAARLLIERVESAARQLAEIPTGRPGRVIGTYEKSVLRSPYIIAYAVSENTLTVLRVIHDRREWLRGGWPT